MKPKYDDSAVEIALVDPADFMPPPPEPEPVVEAPPPEPEPLPEPEVEEPVVIEPPKPKPIPKPVPKPVVKQVEKPKPQVVKQEPKPAPPVVAKAAPAPAPTPAPAPVSVPVAPPAPRDNSAAMEGVYTAALRKELEKYKQYPRGREASLQRPEGNVVVWLLVDRVGNVLDAGIESKATSMLLNKAAQTSLRRLEKVSPFPSEAFQGKDKQRFTATFSYNVE